MSHRAASALAAVVFLSLGLAASSCSRNVPHNLLRDVDGDVPFPDEGETSDLGMKKNRDAACAAVTATATLGKKPVDIIFIIDNSGSMTDKILGVQSNINQNFAQIIGASGLDYRVIMLSAHGDAAKDQYICVSKPLSGNPTCSPPPAKPVNTANFFQYSLPIGSNDEFRKFLQAYNTADPNGQAPGGLSDWLRPDAFQFIIVITDDDSDLPYAQFESMLFALQPARFGDANNRNYRFHSIIGCAPNNPPNKPWSAADPIVTGKCSVPIFGFPVPAPGSGQDYQHLSKLTGGVRFPICELQSYSAVFQEVAKGVIAGARVSCDFAVPAAPMGEKVDLSTVILTYQPGTGAQQEFTQVPDLAHCASGSFYIDNGRIYLCPAACSAVQADNKASVQVTFDCAAPIG